MTDELQDLTAADLVPELNTLRKSGLANPDLAAVANLARLSVEAGFGAEGESTVLGLQNYLRAAVGLIDNDVLESSAAHLFGLSNDVAPNAPLKQRTGAAMVQRGIKYRAYTGKPQTDDLEMVAGFAISLHRVTRQRLREQQRQLSGLPPTPDLYLDDAPEAVVSVLGDRPALGWLDARQEKCADLWAALLKARDEALARIGEPPDKLCIFASGSYGREEAMEFSDLDLFLVHDAPGGDPQRHGRLDKFELGRALSVIDDARVARGIQRFSQGGYYQEPQSFRQMLVPGERQQEERSTLTTARSLLLANSRCFVNPELYAEMRELAMNDYWRDPSGSKSRRLIPSFLINDLRRLWLTMLVDFEHFFPKESSGSGGRPVSGIDRRIAGLKLGLPQQLGCYTPILGLLERCSANGIDRAGAEHVLNLTTRQRLDMLAESSDPTIAGAASALRTLYAQYLAFSWCDKEEMADRVDRQDWYAIKGHFNRAHNLILLMLWTYNASIPGVARFALV